MEIKQIKNINEALDTLWKHDQANQKINFPKDSPNHELFKKSMLENYKEQSKGFFLVYDNERIIGSMLLRIRINQYRRQKYGEVWYIYLDDSCRGKGYGTRLLDFADEYFKSNDCEYAFAGISAFNPASNALFDKSGYNLTRKILEKDL